MKRVLLGLAAAAALAGCAQKGPSADGERAVATLQPKSGTSTQGTVTFTQHGSHVMVLADVTGLPPNSVHGFHVHEKGDCSAPDAMSAGGHFNPSNKPHGSIANPQHHAGDMPNLTSDASGRARASFHLTDITVTPGANSVVDRAVVVHTGPDDYQTQPTGNSGGRIACGTVVKS
ncbi:superoxide dismutase family protein [Paracidovorax citrulli]